MIFNDFFDILDDAEHEDEQMRAPPIFRHRQYFELENFEERFRLNRQQFDNLLTIIGPNLQPIAETNHILTPTDKLLIGLRFYASGGIYNLIGDALGPSKQSVCNAIKQVTRAINFRLFQHAIAFPQNMGITFYYNYHLNGVTTFADSQFAGNIIFFSNN